MLLRLIHDRSRSDHVSDALVRLHWVLGAERIQHMIARLSYKVLHGVDPLVWVADLATRRNPRTTQKDTLIGYCDGLECGILRFALIRDFRAICQLFSGGLKTFKFS